MTISEKIQARFSNFRTVYGVEARRAHDKILLEEAMLSDSIKIDEAICRAVFISSFSFSIARISQGFGKVHVSLSIPGPSGHATSTFHFDSYKIALEYAIAWSEKTLCESAYVLANLEDFPGEPDDPAEIPAPEKKEPAIDAEKTAAKILDSLYPQKSTWFTVLLGARDAHVYKKQIRTRVLEDAANSFEVATTEDAVRHAVLVGLNKASSAISFKIALLSSEEDPDEWSLSISDEDTLFFPIVEDALEAARVWRSMAPFGELRWVRTEHDAYIFEDLDLIDVRPLWEGEDPAKDAIFFS